MTTQDREQTILDLPAAGGQLLRLRALTYRGKEQIDLRRWWTDDDGAVKPGKGIRFSAEVIGQIRAALTEAEDALEAGLIDDADAAEVAEVGAA